VIEEDRTFHQSRAMGTPPPAQTLATSFHKSFMRWLRAVALAPSAADPRAAVYTQSRNPLAVPPDPQITLTTVVLDPNKFYYFSLPGDAANPFNCGNTVPGHTMGGSPTIPSPAASSLTAFAPVTLARRT